ncbi:MAG: cytochrome c-type biogenesis protein CcmH [Gemmatimonadetes bacterium]|nr:cytochrome c-type biogenesis protein CcmH [Gemmatimonadota bacterium]
MNRRGPRWLRRAGWLALVVSVGVGCGALEGHTAAATPTAPAPAPPRAAALQTSGQPAPPAGISAPVQADSALEARVGEIASQLRCPVCQGLSLKDSPTDLAQEMKAVIREQLAAGRTPKEVKDYFVSKYGEFILLSPEPRGFNLVVYLLPFIALLAGAAVVVASVRRWSRAGPGADAADRTAVAADARDAAGEP